MMRFHLPLLFVVISAANLLVQSSWKFLHHAIPKLPFRSVWPSYGICFCQIGLMATLIFYGWGYSTSESQENGVGFQLFKDYAERHADNFKTVRDELPKLQYPSYHHFSKQLPSDLFLLNTRNQALEIVESYNIRKPTNFSYFFDQECRDASELLEDANSGTFQFFAPIGRSLDQSVAEWNKVVVEQKLKIKAHMQEEKIHFERHLARTGQMTEDVILYWTSAHVMLREFMLALTRYENEFFMFVYTAPAAICLFHAFWTAFCSLLCTHTPLDSMWRIIMKWTFYIGSSLALVLALYQIYLGNVTPSCQPIPNEFHKVRYPAYGTNSNIFFKPDFFQTCAQNRQKIFEASQNAILITNSHLAAGVSAELKKVAASIFSTIPELDKIVAHRSKFIFPVVRNMTSIIKSCPKLIDEVKPFLEIGKALKDYMLVRKSSPTAESMVKDSMDYSLARMDRLVNGPIDKFNDVVRNTNFRCDEYQEMFESAAKISCDVANVEAMELFRVAIFGCLSLVSLLYLFYWRRADNSQYWNDPRVKFAQKFMTKNMDDEHYKEWKKVNFKHPEGATYNHFVKNKKKNRYVDIPLIDQSRVVLENNKTDYIHASWIPIPGTNRKYIATQAPLKNTYNEFWHMLIQENVKIVVMLTGFIELDLNICDFYFPGEVGMVKEYGQVEVTCVSVKDSPPEARLVLTVERVFQLRDLRYPDDPPQFVTHVHFQNWFAEVVPKFLCRVIFFHRYLDWLVTDDTPIVVHCNSGTERTGVLIAVDYAHELVIQDRFVSLKSVAEDLGRLRWGVLDSFVPYIFITATLTTRFLYENYLFEDDYFVAYEKYSATKNNRLGKQDKMRRKKGVQLHYWKTFEVPDYYKPRIRRHAVFRKLDDVSSESSNEE